MTNLSELQNALSSKSYFIFSSASEPGDRPGDGLAVVMLAGVQFFLFTVCGF